MQGHWDMARQDDSYNVALAFAFLLFLIGLLAEPRLRQRVVWTRLSERSYSLYLLHGVIAFPVLDALYPALPIELAVVLAVVATFTGVEVSYRLVEAPSHRLARWLSHRGRAAGGEVAPTRQNARATRSARRPSRSRPAAEFMTSRVRAQTDGRRQRATRLLPEQADAPRRT